MGDWDYLYGLRERGYGPEAIADAASSGAAPWDWQFIDEEWITSEIDGEPDAEVGDIQPSRPARSRDGYPYSLVRQGQIFEDLLDCAQSHFENTGRYLQVWGELGEIYAELKFGLRRHGTHHAGSDGTIDGVRVEVKTISPERSSRGVRVKRQGDFEKLLIIRINEAFQFKGKLLDRSELKEAGFGFMTGKL